MKRQDTGGKSIFLMLIVLISTANIMSLLLAHGEETFAQAEEIIKEKISCSELTEDQLEILGDYYMEQMHPGEAHQYMDEMMGGEGSENLRLMHIKMAEDFYCGRHEAVSGGMMDMMMGRTGMMRSYWGGTNNKNIGTFGWIMMILTLIVLVMLIQWLIKELQKPWQRRKR